jgi:outer membrane protein assembly factor BamB
MRALQIGGIILGIIILATASYFGTVAYKNGTLSQEKKSIAKFLELPLSKDAVKNLLSQAQAIPQDPNTGKDFKTVWIADYSGNRIMGIDRTSGKIIWNQTFSFPSVTESGQASNAEFMTIAPNGDIMMSNSNGMLIQELDRTSHEVVWQYGVLNQQYCNRCLHQPKKAYLISDGHEVLVTDANNRRIIIIDKATKQIIWEYGHKAEMRDAVGYLKGNRFAMPLDATASRILISDTLTKRIMIVDRATKTIQWQWTDTDSKWLQNVFPTPEGTFVAEDHLADKVFEVNKDGQMLWTLRQLADGTTLHYPTDAIKLGNGNVLIAEGGKRRIIEVNPQTGEITWQFTSAGLPTAIDVEY